MPDSVVLYDNEPLKYGSGSPMDISDSVSAALVRLATRAVRSKRKPLWPTVTIKMEPAWIDDISFWGGNRVIPGMTILEVSVQVEEENK